MNYNKSPRNAIVVYRNLIDHVGPEEVLNLHILYNIFNILIKFNILYNFFYSTVCMEAV